MDWFSYFAGFEGIAGYVVVLFTLVACGLGVPIPEDIILISGGYIASLAGHTEWPMVVTGLVGIILGDSITFFAGRRFGLSLVHRTVLGRYLTVERLQKTDALFKKHGEKILVAARFMPGVRAVAFFSAGAMRVPYWKFLLFDGVAALVSAPLWVILGFRVGPTVVGWAKQFSAVLVAIVLVLLAAFLVYRYVRGRRLARLPIPAPVPLPATTRPTPPPAPARAESS